MKGKSQFFSPRRLLAGLALTLGAAVIALSLFGNPGLAWGFVWQPLLLTAIVALTWWLDDRLSQPPARCPVVCMLTASRRQECPADCHDDLAA